MYLSRTAESWYIAPDAMLLLMTLSGRLRLE